MEQGHESRSLRPCLSSADGICHGGTPRSLDGRLVVGQGTGPFPGSWQQTDTHGGVPAWVIVTVAVELSRAPLPTSVPAAAAPPFWSTPNHGSGPIWKLLLAGVATIVAISPAATEAVTVASVDPAPPLISTEHQLRKLSTVSVAVPPPVGALGRVPRGGRRDEVLVRSQGGPLHRAR